MSKTKLNQDQIEDLAVTESNLSLSDVTTNDSTTLKHGLLPKLSGVAGQILSGLGTWVALAESYISFTDITDNDVSITKHGFAPKLPNDATKFLNGIGGYTTPTPALDSWMPSPAWTRVDSSTFTVTGDYTAILVKGTKLRYVQSSSTKYAVIISSTYSAPNTTVVVAANDDYSIVSSAISGEYYSYIATPPGYPGFFNYTPTFGGFSSAPSPVHCTFSIQGRQCVVHIDADGGTSNATTFTVSAPASNGGVISFNVLAFIRNNSVAVTNVVASVYITAGSSTMNLSYLTGWTNTGTKGASFTLMYEI